MWKKYNGNPENKNVGDCVVRAIASALDQTWEETYVGICLQGYLMRDMPSSNSVWGAYLRTKGWNRHILSMDYPVGYNVEDFAEEHDGNYIVALDGHVVCVQNNCFFDTWDSGDMPVIYFWEKET